MWSSVLCACECVWFACLQCVAISLFIPQYKDTAYHAGWRKLVSWLCVPWFTCLGYKLECVVSSPYKKIKQSMLDWGGGCHCLLTSCYTHLLTHTITLQYIDIPTSLFLAVSALLFALLLLVRLYTNKQTNRSFVIKHKSVACIIFACTFLRRYKKRCQNWDLCLGCRRSQR